MHCTVATSRRLGAGIVMLLAMLALGLCISCRSALAYSAAGDRLFPATAWLPQIAPSDALYAWGWTLPLDGDTPGAGKRVSSIALAFNKTITERLGFVIENTWSHMDRIGMHAWEGWKNLDTEIKYLAIDSHPHEFLLTFGVDREFATGDTRLGASSSGATTPRIYFGKGLGDLDIGNLRPLAVTGLIGYQFADSFPRPDRVTMGLVVEYSIPYLQSKVRSFDLPNVMRGLTPMVEISLNVPSGRRFGARTTGVISPGLSYSGAGWEFHVAALVPLTHATAYGTGVIAQIHLSLDYFFSRSIGRPLFTAN